MAFIGGVSIGSGFSMILPGCMEKQSTIWPENLAGINLADCSIWPCTKNLVDFNLVVCNC